MRLRQAQGGQTGCLVVLAGVWRPLRWWGLCLGCL